MTPEQFNTWLAYHTGVMPGVAGFLRRRNNPGEIGEGAMVEAWFSVMSWIEIDDAMEATKRILGGLENPPGWNGEDKPVGTYDSDIQQTPAVICRIANRIAMGRRVEEVRSAGVCKVCENTQISVYSPMAHRLMARYGGFARHPHGNLLLSVICLHNGTIKQPGFDAVEYDASKHVILQYGDPFSEANIEKLRTAVTEERTDGPK